MAGPWRGTRPGALPEGLRVFAIGDIHGCLRELLALEAAIDARIAACPAGEVLVIYLGDYIDRGPDSARVLSHLSGPRHDGIRRRHLMGNHEAVFLQVLADADAWPAWRGMGGLETVFSYDKALARDAMRDPGAMLGRLAAALPEPHLRFLSSLEHVVAVGDCVFVHAGIDPRRPLAQQRAEDLLWIREPFLAFEGALPRFVVHGHTPVPEPELRPHRLNLDLGAYLTGRLACAELEGDRIEVFEA